MNEANSTVPYIPYLLLGLWIWLSVFSTALYWRYKSDSEKLTVANFVIWLCLFVVASPLAFMLVTSKELEIENKKQEKRII